MYSKIILFHELRLPHLDGGRKEQWCTYSKDNGMHYLLNGGRHELGDIGDDDIDIYKDIHFVTEADCHFQAHAYYSNYKQEYPYMDEWKESLTVEAFENNKFVVESEIMRFE